jgi:hypothetical protein
MMMKMRDNNQQVPPAKARNYLSSKRYGELGADGKLRLFEIKGKNHVLVAVSQKTYDRLSWWAIIDAFPDVKWEWC